MLNVRSASGLSADIKSVVPSGTTFTITSGPVAEDGYYWYFVAYTSGTGTGWVAGEFLALSGTNTGFTIGDSVFVASINLNLRSDPGLDATILDVLPGGAEFTVVSGATNLDGYDWYEVSNSAVYGTGWVAGEFLELGGSGGDTSFADGDSVQTTDVLNVRSAAGFEGAIFRTASVGEVFTVSNNVIVMDGYTWHLVTSSTEDMPLDGGEGWVAGEFLTFAA